MVSVCSARNLDSYLARAKLHLLEILTGSFKCKSKPSQVCNNMETDSFTCWKNQTDLRLIIGLIALKSV